MSRIRVEELEDYGTGEVFRVSELARKEETPEVVEYGEGVLIDSHNTLIRDADNRFWIASGNTTLPYETTGEGLPEGGALIPANPPVDMSQTEAESGTSSIVKGVSALRIRQSIVAWWESVKPTSWGRSLIDANNATAGRTVLGLGNSSTLDLASHAQAEAGTVNTVVSTPQRVFQAIRGAAANASETLRGTLRIATSVEATSLSNNTVTITPSKLGVVLNDNVLGMNQVVEDVTAARAVNTTYTNTTGRAIVMMINIIQGIAGRGKLFVSEVEICENYQEAPGETNLFTVIVPAGATYRYEVTAGTQTINRWVILQ